MSIARVVVFDLDDTLVVEEAGATEALGEVVGRLAGRPAGPGDVRLALDAIRGVWQEGPCFPLALELGIASWEGLWASFEGSHPRLDELRAFVPAYRRRAWEAALRALGLDDALAGEAAATYRRLQLEPRPLVDGAAELVRRLATKGARLGLLTNGPSDIQRRKLAQSGLEACFEAVVISGETGVGKPSAAAFAAVLDRLHVAPDEAVMVGDSVERDVLGALGAGLQPVWVSRGRRLPDHVSDVPVVGRLAELADLLELDRSVRR